MDIEDPNKNKPPVGGLRERSMAEGRAALAAEGFNPDEYRQFFPLMRKCDLPINSCTPTVESLTDRKLLERLYQRWKVIADGYKHIDPEEYDETLGKLILTEMKELVPKFDQLFSEYVADPASKALPELLALRERIFVLADEHNRIPAYKAYRYYGYWELDEMGRRGFQVKDDEE